jgi:hypothetical protein
VMSMDLWGLHAEYDGQAGHFNDEVLRKIAYELKEVLGPRYTPRRL